MSIQRAGMVASLILMLFLLTGGYYVQVCMLCTRSSNIVICMLNCNFVSLLSQFHEFCLSIFFFFVNFIPTILIVQFWFIC